MALRATSCSFFPELFTGKFMALKGRVLCRQTKKTRRIFRRTRETLPLVAFW